MQILDIVNQKFTEIMKEETGVLGAWEFGSGMYHTRDEYSDIDIVFLAAQADYAQIDNQLKDILQRVCDEVVIFWAEDFNGEAIKNYDCILNIAGEFCQYDIFLINEARIEDHICQIHYADITVENIFFDRAGAVAALIGKPLSKRPWQDDIMRLIDTYWLHIYMTEKYFIRKDFFKLEGVLRILMDTHISLLLLIYDKTTWGGTANKLHYLPQDKQNHLKKYYFDGDFEKVKNNLRQAMLWFREDVKESGNAAAEKKCLELAEKIAEMPVQAGTFDGITRESVEANLKRSLVISDKRD